MNDRELLEAAAKAAGIKAVAEFTFECDGTSSGICQSGLWNRDRGGIWNPLTDDGDALRLAVKLGMHCVDGFPVPSQALAAECGGDWYAATRRAIVLEAAALKETP